VVNIISAAASRAALQAANLSDKALIIEQLDLPAVQGGETVSVDV
jgi:hypothetical protein